ncbi:MAG: hypothetical protein KC535_06035, partial [Nanoarchaeota archaeon]|nr:hypothetical protein [Nanoarchaeota archaeon]
MDWSYKKSHQGELFLRPVKRLEQFGYECIKIDDVPKDVSAMVQDVWNRTLGTISSQSSREELAKKAHECSVALY